MRRRPADPERTRAVLMFCAAVALAFALLLAVWAAVTATVLPVVVSVVLVGLAIACVRLGQDDGRGTWCRSASRATRRTPPPASPAEPALADEVTTPGLRALRIEQVGFSHPDAMALTEEVQQEYVVRYGERDTTPLDHDMFEPPGGRFFVGYLHDVPVATGAWRARSDVEALGSTTTAEIKRMYVAATARGTGLARQMLAHLESTAAEAGADVMILETGLAQPEAIALYQSSGYTRIPPYGWYKEFPNVRCFAKPIG